MFSQKKDKTQYFFKKISMNEKDDSVLPADSITQSDSSQKGSVVDMMLGKSSEKVIDSETMIQETQKRI